MILEVMIGGERLLAPITYKFGLLCSPLHARVDARLRRHFAERTGRRGVLIMEGQLAQVRLHVVHYNGRGMRRVPSETVSTRNGSASILRDSEMVIGSIPDLTWGEGVRGVSGKKGRGVGTGSAGGRGASGMAPHVRPTSLRRSA